MTDFWQIVSTHPSHTDYHLFEDVIKNVYDEGSQRFILGHEPSAEHLISCHVLLRNDMPVGRYAYYENPKLVLNEKKTAMIGSYECIDIDEASERLLKHSINLSKIRSCSELIGPMEGSTWQTYRFSVHNDHPNFFMEPYHHTYYNRQFVNAGFKPIAHYYSNLDRNIAFEDDEIASMEHEYNIKGATIRTLNMEQIEKDLSAIARLSIEGFANNYLYTPISVADFVKKYKRLSSYFDPELIWIIEDNLNEIHAFIFAVKDHFDPSEKTLIIKSLVRKKDSPFKGVGKFLSAKLYQIAKARGYNKMIHALMIEDNASRKISERMAVDHYKSYLLYGISIEEQLDNSSSL